MSGRLEALEAVHYFINRIGLFYDRRNQRETDIISRSTIGIEELKSVCWVFAKEYRRDTEHA